MISRSVLALVQAPGCVVQGACLVQGVVFSRLLNPPACRPADLLSVLQDAACRNSTCQVVEHLPRTALLCAHS